LRKLLVFVLLLMLCSISFATEKKDQKETTQAQDKQVQKAGNVCYTESVEAARGTSFPVKVFVSNVDTLAGMQVPIYYRSEDVDLKCDSITFVGSRCKDFALSFPMIEPVGKTAFFCFIYATDASQEVQPLMPGDGLVATMWFTAPKDIKAGQVTLESGPNAFYPHPKIDYSFLFWDPNAEQVDFTYKAGYITVK
jgi:hypothetical protein